MLKALPVCLLFLLFFLYVSAAAADDFRCNCDEEGFWSTERILESQRISDILIAVAYFSIPVELLYFVSCSNFPFKWVLFQFIAFIGFCGLTHLLNAWTFRPHSFQLMLALTVLKILTALVSFATAITLISLIPMLLKVKVRELLLKKKTWDLDREVLIIKKQNEAFLHVRMLTQEIRKTLDRHTILYTTLVELSKTLDLKNCVIWMPNASGTEMNLTHQLKEKSFLNMHNSTVPISDPDVCTIKGSDGAKILDPESPLAVASSGGIGEPGSVAAIRMQMLMAANFKGGTPENIPVCYAMLVLVLPDGQSRTWTEQELEIVQVVSDQVAVALSHVSVLEETQLMSDQLIDRNRSLQQAKQDVLMASQARDTFQTVMSEGLKRPLHSIIGLLSVFQDEKLSDEQLLLVDSMVKTSSVLSTLITDLVDVCGRDISRFPIQLSPFQLHSMIRETSCLYKCLGSCKGLRFVAEIDKSLPNHVLGDERRVFRVILHMVDCLLKGCKGRGVLVFRAYAASRSQGWNEHRWGQWRSNLCDEFAFIKFEVGIRYDGSWSEEILPVIGNERQRSSHGAEESMSFIACKKLVQLMQGDIWAMLNPEGLDQGMALALRFQLPRPIIRGMSSEHGSSSDGIHSTNSVLNGLRVLLADADDANRAVTRKLLEKLGCNVSTASSGYECVSAVGHSVPQIVLLDPHLPDLDGFEVTLRIRKFQSRNWPLIVALTSSNTGDVADKCLQIGMNGVVHKPGSLKEIAAELKRVLMQANTLLS